MPKLTNSGLKYMEENPRLSKKRKPKEQTLPITENPPVEEPTAEEPEAKKSKEHVTVPVKYIRLLADVLGTHAEAARHLGVAPSLVSNAIKTGMARQVNELAARFILDNIGEHIFGAMTPEEIIRSLRRDLAEAGKHGLEQFHFDDAGTLRATVRKNL